jgi:integral membrane protein
MMSESSAPIASDKRVNALKGALARYRVMAFVMGVWSLLLWGLDLPTKFWAKGIHKDLIFIGIAHGILYPIYVLSAFFYCLRSGKKIMETFLFIIAGTLPFLSFFAERKALKDFQGLMK